MTFNNPFSPELQPKLTFREQQAMDTCEAHSALIMAETMHSRLKDNPAWNTIRADAFEAFINAFEAI